MYYVSKKHIEKKTIFSFFEFLLVKDILLHLALEMLSSQTVSKPSEQKKRNISDCIPDLPLN